MKAASGYQRALQAVPARALPARGRVAHLARYAWWPALALLAWYVLCYFQFAGQLIAYPFGVDQGEGYDVWSAWLLTLGQLPYSGNSAYPYFSSNYPPLWSALAAIPMFWVGPSIGIARALSVLSALVAAALIGRAAYRRTRGVQPVVAGFRRAAGHFPLRRFAVRLSQHAPGACQCHGAYVQPDCDHTARDAIP